MDQIIIHPDDPLLWAYYAELQQLRSQGVYHEGATRRAFSNLLQGVARKRDWILIEELPIDSRRGSGSVRPDGTLRDRWQLPHGWWEAKDISDDLESEIDKKINTGYPLENTIFENTQTAILYQNNYLTFSCSIQSPEKLAELLTRFLNHDFKPFEDFEQAIARYGKEIPNIASTLKAKIDEAHDDNTMFALRYADFMQLCKTSLDPNISRETVDEMLIQHLMTERIIRRVFGVEEFVRRNVIAAEIEKVIDALTSHHFNRIEFLGALDLFYLAIESAADHLLGFYDKQDFVNTVYERFFQDYSVETADTHGIVYTPQPIVDFMCTAVEEALRVEFGVDLGDECVLIIDPATGTGNFVVNLLRRAHSRNPRSFEDFYKHRIFANEVLLMPYYIASLNVEHEYVALKNRYLPFPGLCFVDTLDLAVTTGDHAGRRQSSYLFSEGNTRRVTNQVSAPINVVIGNPPYNVGQTDENDNNKNREYPLLDRKIRNTYSKDSKAQLKSKIKDAYVRFWRWATDRLQGRNGIVCYVTNNGFVEAASFDGMRRHFLQDFTKVYHLDLGGNVRKKTSSGSFGNVFNITVGVGITIAIRNDKHIGHELHLAQLPEDWTRKEKLDFLSHASHQSILSPPPPSQLWEYPFKWEKRSPDRNFTWLVSDTKSEFEGLIPLGTERVGRKRVIAAPEVIFQTYSLGVSTNRDPYVHDFNFDQLAERVQQCVRDYNSEVERYRLLSSPSTNVDDFVDYKKLSWSETLKNHLRRHTHAEFSPKLIRTTLWRPFTKKRLYYSKPLVDRPGKHQEFFPTRKSESENQVIWFKVGAEWPLFSLMVNRIPNLLPQTGSQCFPFFVYSKDGANRRENITDWSLKAFRRHYNDPTITKWDIFNYVYGLLYHPGFCEHFATDLKRHLPRITLAPAFRLISIAGSQLADLHVNYESVQRYKLDWESTRDATDDRVSAMLPKGKVNSADGNYKVYPTLKYNNTLTLHGIPERAFAYRLGKRSALDWLVNQYQSVRPQRKSDIVHDPNGYSDDPQYILKLIERVITVSLRTVDIVEGLAKLPFRPNSKDD